MHGTCERYLLLQGTMPKRALTAAAIERIKPPAEGQVDYFDRGYPGLALRVSYGGARSFCYFYRVGGKQRRYKLGLFPAMSLAEAREAWRLAREDVGRGRDPATVRKRETGATSFEGVVAEWLKRDQSKNRTHDEVKRAVDRVLVPAWGHRSVADIGRRDISTCSTISPIAASSPGLVVSRRISIASLSGASGAASSIPIQRLHSPSKARRLSAIACSPTTSSRRCGRRP